MPHTVLTPLCCGCVHRYDFATVHSTAKGLFTSIDCFMYGAEVSSLLLWWGDVTAMRAGVAKVLDAHAKVLGSVQRGETSAETCAYEAFCACVCLAQPLLAANEFELLREFLANSMVGLALTDDAVHAGVASFWAGAFGAWKSEDGHCHTTLDTWLLVVRGLTALVEEDTESSRAILREWLPPPDELLRISEYECAWRAKPLGAADPALLCARLHGERLGTWATAAEVAEGVLTIEQFNPLLRTEAYRLLGRARHALGEIPAAAAAAECAAAEAAGARYLWLEMLALRDQLLWCEAGAAEGVQSRLSALVGRAAASAEEVAAVLGECSFLVHLYKVK